MNSNSTSIPSTIYESMLPAFFLSIFELMFFLVKIRKDIDNGINSLTHKLSREFETLFNELKTNYEMDDEKLKAIMYQSAVLLSKFQDAEIAKMEAQNHFRVQIAYSISVVLFILILLSAMQVKNDAGELDWGSLFSGYLFLNTLMVITAVGIFQYMFYTNFVMKYIPADENELTLHLLQELKIMFKNFDELNCPKNELQRATPYAEIIGRNLL